MIVSERERAHHNAARYLLFKLNVRERNSFDTFLSEVRAKTTKPIRDAHVRDISQLIGDWPAVGFDRRFPDASGVIDSSSGRDTTTVHLRLLANPAHAKAVEDTGDFSTAPLFELSVPREDSISWLTRTVGFTAAASPRLICWYPEMTYPTQGGRTSTFHFPYYPSEERPAGSYHLEMFSRLLGAALASQAPQGQST